jgi:urease accessory protein
MKTPLAFYQLLDSALPVGAFAHSFGVETMIQENEVTNLRELREFIETLLCFNIATSDCLLIKAIYTLDESQVWELDSLLDASRVSRETREGMRRIGKQALKLGKTLNPDWNWKTLPVKSVL